MTKFTSKIGETISIGEDIQLTILRIEGSAAHIRIDSPHRPNSRNPLRADEELPTEGQSVSAPLISGAWLDT